ncbi:MAG: hypothetical protein HQ557_06485 [Bacteroidetes bacterium]|nr:hypothetical protein [Bacteroidota bacterium]
MTPIGKKLTLDEAADFKITVFGYLDTNWSELIEGAVINQTHYGELQLSTLSGKFDQAALHGLLQHLYAMGFPLISVLCDTVSIG